MVTSTPIFPQTIQNYVQQIVNADTQTIKTIATAGANGTKIESLFVTSTDSSSARDVQFVITISLTNYIIGTVSIPINSGNTNALPAISILNNSQLAGLATDANGNKYLYLKNGATLGASALTTVTAAKVISLVASGGDY